MVNDPVETVSLSVKSVHDEFPVVSLDDPVVCVESGLIIVHESNEEPPEEETGCTVVVRSFGVV
ncbi:MAG: hypothetical protein Q8O99_07550 [bacterium]|nr:hypothetical protein [bacterium]